MYHDPELGRLPSRVLIVSGSLTLLGLVPVGGYSLLIAGWWPMYGETTPPQLFIAAAFLGLAAVGAVLATRDQVIGAVMVLAGCVISCGLQASVGGSDTLPAIIGSLLIAAISGVGALVGHLQHIERSRPRLGSAPSSWGPPPPGRVLPQPPGPIPPGPALPGQPPVADPTRRLP